MVSELNTWLGIPHKVSLIGRHESNGTEHVNALLLGHLRRLVHDEHLVHQWSSDTVLSLINHALTTSPNTELGGISPAELKFGTIDYKRFSLPVQLVPGNNYGDLVNQLDHNFAAVRNITANYQQSLRVPRQDPTSSRNTYQPGNLILWNPRENQMYFLSTKLATKLLGPYIVHQQLRNTVICRHILYDTEHSFHSNRVSLFIGPLKDAQHIGLLDEDEYVVGTITDHHGNFEKLSTVYFLVHWHGYDSTYDTWEPWNSLRDVAALHAYLRLKNLQKTSLYNIVKFLTDNSIFYILRAD